MADKDEKVRAEIRRRQAIIKKAYDAGDEIVCALSGDGERAFEWQDKPHRLAYDLIVERADLRARVKRLDELLQEAFADAETYHVAERERATALVLALRQRDRAEARVTTLEQEKEQANG